MNPFHALVSEIHALEDAASLADDRRIGLGEELRAAMHLVQVRLVRSFPGQVRRQPETGGWRLILQEPLAGRADAGHLPTAAARGLLGPLEE